MTSSPRLGLLSGLRLAGNGAFRFLYPFLPVVAAELAIPDALSGVLVGSIAVGGMLSPLLRRRLVGDHERPRRLLVTASLVVALGTLAVALAPVAAPAVVALLVLGAGKPLLDTAAISYVSARTAFAGRARATSIMELTWAGGLLVVAPVAGVVAEATSWRVPLGTLAVVIAGLALVAGRSLDADGDGSDEADRGPRLAGDTAAASPPAGRRGLPLGGVRRALAAISDTGRDYLFVVAFGFAALEATFSVFGLWLDRVHGVPLEQLGGFAALVSLGELAGASLVTMVADRVGKARTLWAGLAICAVGLGALALTSTLGFGVAALAVGLVGSETAIVAAIAIASEVEPGGRSRYLAVMFAVTSFTRAVVGGIGPAVFATVGIRGNAALSVTAALVAALMLRRAVHRTPRLAA